MVTKKLKNIGFSEERNFSSTSSTELEALFRPSVQPYLQSILKVDPAIELTKLRLPILLIQGTEDLQISVADAELLKQTVSTAKLAIIPKMNHVLKNVPKSDIKTNLASYRQPDQPLSPELVQTIISFLKSSKVF
ncbi:alpha/beta hydrolase [Liquorilactobacillus sicerae]|uniref:alpha/beta hydrolase n=1 Tax=Liquorilactobacillus sicerae TaxID=1416943 RepID=UPI002480E856|nr:alpha/beta hydrolase [Liquorilactobacillus sicerae]